MKASRSAGNERRAFGEVLTATRKRCGMSQETLAFESGLHRTYISQLERGLKAPTLETLFDLARALEVTPTDLISQTELLLATGNPPSRSRCPNS